MTIDQDSTKPLSNQADLSVEEFERMAGSFLEIVALGITNGKIKVDVLLHGKTAPVISSIVEDGGNASPDEATVGGAYTGEADEEWEVRITTGGVYTTFQAAVYKGNEVIHGPWTPTSAASEPIADGVTVIFTDAGASSMTLDDKWIITNVASDIKPVQVDSDGKLVTV